MVVGDVQVFELLLLHCIFIGPVVVVRYEVVTRVVPSRPFLRLDAASVRGSLGPHRRRLHVRADGSLPICAGEDISVNCVDVAIVIDDPVAWFRALLTFPFSIDEAVGLQGEPDGSHRPIRTANVTPTRSIDHLQSIDDASRLRTSSNNRSSGSTAAP